MQISSEDPSVAPLNALLAAVCDATGPLSAISLYWSRVSAAEGDPPVESVGSKRQRGGKRGARRGAEKARWLQGTAEELAEVAAKAARRLRADGVTIGMLAKAAMVARSGSLARWVQREAERWGVAGSEGAVVCLIKAFEVAGEVSDALAVREWAVATGAPVTAGVWSALIMAAGRSGLMDRSFTLWGDMLAAGVTPRQPQFHALLIACGGCTRPDRAIHTLREMREAGVARTHVTYTLALMACVPGLGGRPSEEHVSAARQILEEMRADLPRQEMTLEMGTTLVKLYGEAGMADEALEVFERLRLGHIGGKKEVDARAYSTAIRACRGRSDLADTAKELYDESQVRDGRKCLRLLCQMKR